MLEPELEKYIHKRGEPYLAISCVSHHRRLEVATQRARPLGLLIGLKLEDDMEDKEKKNMRARLISRLAGWCSNGGVSSVPPNIPAELYKYTRNAEDKIFTFILDRLATTFGISDPRKRDSARKVPPLPVKCESQSPNLKWCKL
jgi:hypothetical protein